MGSQSQMQVKVCACAGVVLLYVCRTLQYICLLDFDISGTLICSHFFFMIRMSLAVGFIGSSNGVIMKVSSPRCEVHTMAANFDFVCSIRGVFVVLSVFKYH